MREYKSRLDRAIYVGRVVVGKGLIGLMALFTAGCGTLISGTEQYISINSSPSGAVVKENYWEIKNSSSSAGSLRRALICRKKVEKSRKIGYTPFTYFAKRKNPGTLVFEKQGYETKQLELRKQFNPISLLNLLFGPGFIIGGLVDSSSGGSKKIVPKDIHVHLRKKDYSEEKSEQKKEINIPIE